MVLSLTARLHTPVACPVTAAEAENYDVEKEQEPCVLSTLAVTLL